MTANLTRQFDDFARGVTSANAFAHELLTLCNTTPDCAWDVLALLDQYHRRRKVSAELYQSIRHRIERHVLGIEKLPADLEPDGGEPVRAPIEVPAVREPAVCVLPVRVPAVRVPAARVPAVRAAADASAAPLRAAAAAAIIFTEQGAASKPSAPVLPFSHLLAETSSPGTSGAGEWKVPRWQLDGAWRPRAGRTHALALAAMVFGVTASPSVRELPPAPDTAYRGSPQPAVPEPRSPAPEVVSLSSDQYVVYPNRKSAEILVQRGAQVQGAASFIWWTEGAGAKPNEDFISGPPRLIQMPDGVASVKLQVPILANPARRHTEMFYVSIGKLGGGARLGPIRRATVFIMPRA